MTLRGWNAYDLAESSGVPQSTIFRFLSGQHGEPRGTTIRKLAAGLGVTEADLRGFSEAIKPILPDPLTETNEHIKNDLINRVNEAISTLGRGGKVAIAEKCGITPQAINGWITTGRIDKDNLAVISEMTGYELNWLITGNGLKLKTIKPSLPAPITENKIESNAIWYGEFDLWDSSTPLRDDEVALPFFREVKLSAGKGISEVQENHGAKLRFAKSTLKRKGISTADAACVVVSGNSMEPVLPDGSTIGIDTSKTDIINGKMYAIDHDGQLRVKMIYNLPGGGLRLKSFNTEEWPDEPYLDTSKIRILGQVFWSSVLW